MISQFKLSSEQILQFHLQGFLSIPTPISPPEELEWMIEEYDNLFTTHAGRAEGNQFDLGGADEDEDNASLPQILNPAHYAPRLNEGVYLQNANSIVKQLFGPVASAGVAHAIYKPAGIGGETPWHQDEAYWDPGYQYCSASIWMPLQEATVENGCLWFMPGSHEWEVLEHRPIGGDIRIHGLEITDLTPIRNPVACPLSAGAITIHRNRTAHYAGRNVSATPRRALILSTGLPSHPYPTGRSFPWNEVKRTARDERAVASKK